MYKYGGDRNSLKVTKQINISICFILNMIKASTRANYYALPRCAGPDKND